MDTKQSPANLELSFGGINFLAVFPTHFNTNNSLLITLLFISRQNTDLYHTPAAAKPLPQAKSTIKRTGSHRKPSTMQPSCERQAMEKSLVRATQCKTQAPPSNADRHEADFSNPETKSYKDKTLDMRLVCLPSSNNSLRLILCRGCIWVYVLRTVITNSFGGKTIHSIDKNLSVCNEFLYSTIKSFRHIKSGEHAKYASILGQVKKSTFLVRISIKKESGRFFCYLLFPIACFLYTLLPSPRDTLELLGQILIKRNIRYWLNTSLFNFELHTKG